MYFSYKQIKRGYVTVAQIVKEKSVATSMQTWWTRWVSSANEANKSNWRSEPQEVAAITPKKAPNSWNDLTSRLKFELMRLVDRLVSSNSLVRSGSLSVGRSRRLLDRTGAWHTTVRRSDYTYNTIDAKLCVCFQVALAACKSSRIAIKSYFEANESRKQSLFNKHYIYIVCIL